MELINTWLCAGHVISYHHSNTRYSPRRHQQEEGDQLLILVVDNCLIFQTLRTTAFIAIDEYLS